MNGLWETFKTRLESPILFFPETEPQSIYETTRNLRSSANAINQHGDIVGWADFTHDGTSVTAGAFLYQNGHLVDLNSVTQGLEGFKLIEANDINDFGDLVGYGFDADGNVAGFLLTPSVSEVPEPSGYSLAIVIVLASLFCVRMRQRKDILPRRLTDEAI